MVSERSDWVVLMLITANMVFLGWVGDIWLDVYNSTQMGVPQLPVAEEQEHSSGARAVAERAVGKHLPLAGMPGSAPADPDACLRLEGFLLDAGRHLTNHGEALPLTRAGIKALVAEGTCSVTDPAVADTVSAYGTAWLSAGLPPIGPFQGK